jgi:hypothetical protein
MAGPEATGSSGARTLMSPCSTLIAWQAATTLSTSYAMSATARSGIWPQSCGFETAILLVSIAQTSQPPVAESGGDPSLALPPVLCQRL